MAKGPEQGCSHTLPSQKKSVLRIRAAILDPGFGFFPVPARSGSLISEPSTKKGGKKLVVFPFFVVIYFTQVKY
jgi:hypothetical protein